MNIEEEKISAAIAREERALLRAIGEEPPHILQTLQLFSGPNGWVNIVLIVTQSIAFVGSLVAAWHFFQAQSALEALRWGLPASVLFLTSLIIKMAMAPAIQTNRLLRELRRIESLIAIKHDT